MKFWIAAVIVTVALVLTVAGQVPSQYRIPLWTGVRYEWPALGASFVLRDGRLEVLPPNQPERAYGFQLKPDAPGQYRLPENAKNVVVWINGLRATERVDYVIEGSVLRPLWQWGAQDLIVIDYDS